MISMTVQPKTERGLSAMTSIQDTSRATAYHSTPGGFPDEISTQSEVSLLSVQYTIWQQSGESWRVCFSTPTTLFRLQLGLWLLSGSAPKLKSNASLCSKLDLCHKHFPWQWVTSPMTLQVGGTTHELNLEGGSFGNGNETRFSSSAAKLWLKYLNTSIQTSGNL